MLGCGDRRRTRGGAGVRTFCWDGDVIKTNFLVIHLTSVPAQLASLGATLPPDAIDAPCEDATLLVGAPVPVQEPRNGIRVGGRVRRGQRPVALRVRPALRAREQSREVVAVTDDGVLRTCTD